LRIVGDDRWAEVTEAADGHAKRTGRQLFGHGRKFSSTAPPLRPNRLFTDPSNPPADAPPSRGEALRPGDFSHPLPDAKSLGRSGFAAGGRSGLDGWCGMGGHWALMNSDV
jgi:hypothetical protein